MSTKRIRLSAVASFAALVTGLVVIGPATPTNAVNFTVDTLSDNAADGITLREAITVANGIPGPHRITFADGLTGTITLTGGQLTSNTDLEIVGPGSDLLTIDGNNASRVLEAMAGTDLALEGMTIANGATVGSGGGVAASAVDELSVRDVTFVDNQASNQGGGLWVANPTDSLIEVSNSTFTSNRAGAAGGGMFLADALGNGEIRTAFNTFENNESVNGNGGGAFISAPNRAVFVSATGAFDNDATNANAGGMWIDGSRAEVVGVAMAGNEAGAIFGAATINANVGTVLVVDSTFRSNSADDVGAASFSAPGNVFVTNTVVEENSSLGRGGVAMSSMADIEVERSTFRANTGDIGAIDVSGALSLRIAHSTVADNEGGTYGALRVAGPQTSIVRSTFEGNSADSVAGTGGAIYASGGSDVSALNSTFHRNTAHDGGAIYGAGALTVELDYVTMTENDATGEAGGVFTTLGADTKIINSIVSDNLAPDFPDVNDATLDIDASILGDGAGLFLNGLDVLVGVDPELRPIADNGGPTRTLMPNLASPAIDAAGAGWTPVPHIDQRSRDRDASADMGSVEVGAGDDSIWVSTPPARFVDTRAIGETIDDQNEKTDAFTAGEQRQITFAGRGEVPVDATAVIANITAVNPGGKGFITAHPCVEPRPTIASLNYTVGVNLGNEIVLGLDTGEACIFTSETADLTVDVVGYIPADSPYAAIEPARYADTRATGTTFDGASAGGGAPGAGEHMSVPIRGRGNVPAAATSAVLYVAAVNPASTGFVTVWNCDGDPPLASSLNHVQGVNRGNEVIAKIGDTGSVCFFTSADVELTVDVVGYIPGGTNYDAAESPSRLLDTRPGETTIDGMAAGEGIVGAGESVELIVAGRAGVPGLATTVAINVTAVNPSGPGFVTVYDCNILPLASSLNYVPGVNGGNELIASVNANGRLCLYTSATTHLTADVTGWTSL